jgi:predicted enzyme related to lactoylglutathione lyase
MTIQAVFGHVNLVAADWRRLADFYVRLFGCELVPPERDLGGPALEAGTGVPGARLRGGHFRLPGHGPDGPTLEIFEYDGGVPERQPTLANRPGYGHLAFAVPDVRAARAAVLAEGGRAIGSVVTTAVAGGRWVTWTYVTDPEGNILELQAWSESPPMSPALPGDVTAG